MTTSKIEKSLVYQYKFAGLTAESTGFLSPIFEKKSLAGLLVVIECVFPRRQIKATSFLNRLAGRFLCFRERIFFCRDRFAIVDNFLLDFLIFYEIRLLSRFFFCRNFWPNFLQNICGPNFLNLLCLAIFKS